MNTRRTVRTFGQWLLVLLASLLVAIGVFRLFAQPDIRAAYERVAEGSKLIDTACGPIEYARAGEGVPLLVIHGSGGGFDQGLHISEGLSNYGIERIAVSRFGYLGTPMPDNASAEAQADAHVCLLDALGLEMVAVLGVSAGAPSALQFALRHPERTNALVLMVPALWAPRPDDQPPLVIPTATRVLFGTALRSDFLFWMAPRLSRKSVLRGVLATPPELVDGAGAAEQVRVEATIANILPVRPRRQGLINDSDVTITMPRYPLEDIQAPTLILSAEDDLFGIHDSASYTARHLPNAHHVSWPSGGHLLVGHQQEAMEEIADWVYSFAGTSRPGRLGSR
jgi:2-hydroxy-6-oxonona-2,4-dienedioate hydrolase